jgi:hypothetical protein
MNVVCEASPPTTHRVRGSMGPRDEREDDISGCGTPEPHSRCHPGICLHRRRPVLPGPVAPRPRRAVGRWCGTACFSFRPRGLMGPGDEPRDDIGGWGTASARTNTKPLAIHRTRGFASSSVSPSGAERRGPYRCKFGDAALAAPRATTGPPAASPRSSTPGGEPAYADRRQQGGTDSLMSRAQSWPPDPIADNQLLPAPWVVRSGMTAG